MPEDIVPPGGSDPNQQAERLKENAQQILNQF